MHDINKVANQTQSTQQPVAREILAALERLERRFDEFARVYINACFPYGKPVDRWSRGR